MDFFNIEIELKRLPVVLTHIYQLHYPYLVVNTETMHTQMYMHI